jgi:DNA-binding protein HU-beta
MDPGAWGSSGDPGSIGFAVPDMRLGRVARLNGKKKHGSKNMNRSELVAALADRAEVTRKDADAVLAAFAEVVGEIVAKGDEKVTIPGFLTFERTHRAARTARNPQTGEPIQIPAGYSVKVSAGSKLKEAAKGK